MRHPGSCAAIEARAGQRFLHGTSSSLQLPRTHQMRVSETQLGSRQNSVYLQVRTQRSRLATSSFSSCPRSSYLRQPAREHKSVSIWALRFAKCMSCRRPKPKTRDSITCARAGYTTTPPALGSTAPSAAPLSRRCMRCTLSARICLLKNPEQVSLASTTLEFNRWLITVNSWVLVDCNWLAKLTTALTTALTANLNITMHARVLVDGYDVQPDERRGAGLAAVLDLEVTLQNLQQVVGLAAPAREAAGDDV